MAGRPTKFNKERCDRIVELVRKGNFLTTACKAAKVDPSTVDNWVKRGMEEGKGKYYQFFRALTEAEALAEIDGNDDWLYHRKKSPEATKEYMRRRFQHWNVADKQEIKKEVTANVDVINARVEEYFAEAKKRGVILRDDSEESVDTDNADG